MNAEEKVLLCSRQNTIVKHFKPNLWAHFPFKICFCVHKLKVSTHKLQFRIQHSWAASDYLVWSYFPCHNVLVYSEVWEPDYRLPQSGVTPPVTMYLFTVKYGNQTTDNLSLELLPLSLRTYLQYSMGTRLLITFHSAICL